MGAVIVKWDGAVLGVNLGHQWDGHALFPNRFGEDMFHFLINSQLTVFIQAACLASFISFSFFFRSSDFSFACKHIKNNESITRQHSVFV